MKSWQLKNGNVGTRESEISVLVYAVSLNATRLNLPAGDMVSCSCINNNLYSLFLFNWPTFPELLQVKLTPQKRTIRLYCSNINHHYCILLDILVNDY